MTRVIVVEPQTLVREMLCISIERHQGCVLAGEADNEKDALRLCRTCEPEMLVTETDLRKGDCVRMIRRLTRDMPALKQVVLTQRKNPLGLIDILQARPHGLVSKSDSLEDLWRAIKREKGDSPWLSPTIARLLQDRNTSPLASNVTRREREVAILITEGHANREIASRLGLSAKTVYNHRQNLMRKLGVNNVQHLIRAASELGLVG